MFRIVSDYPAGGKPSYGLQPNFYYLSKEQSRLGNNVVVISRRNGNQPLLEHDGNIEIYRVESPFNLNCYNLLSELSKGRNLSLIHTHSTSGLVLSILKIPIGLPLFAHVHGASRSKRMPQKLKGILDQNFSHSRMWYYYFRERLFWASANRVLAVSNALKYDLMSRYRIHEENINVVYNGVEAQLFQRKVSPQLPPEVVRFCDGKKVVLYVGHFGPRKGLIFLIRAMKTITSTIQDAVAICIGGVPEWLGKQDYWSYLKNEIARLALEDKILLLERIPNEILPEFYSRASVFVLPSFYEAFAKVVLEAMACECATIITREGGPQEAIDDGKSGLLVDYASSTQLADAVIKILRDDRLGRRMGAEARKRILQEFTWQAVAQRINLSYEEVFQRAK